MLSYLNKVKKVLIFLIFFLILGSLSSVLFAIIIERAIDVTVTGEFNEFKKILFYFLLFVVGSFLVGYISNVLNAKLNKKIMVNLRRDVFISLIFLKFDDFKKSSSGNKISIFENDLKIIERDYFNSIVSIIQSLLLFTFSVIYLIQINFILALSIIIGSILLLIIPVLFSRELNVLNSKLSDQVGQYLTSIKDYFTGIEVIKSNSIEKKVIEEYTISNEKMEDARYHFNKKLALFEQVSLNSSYILVVICFAVGGILLLNKDISIGQLIASVQLLNNIMSPASNISQSLMGIKGCTLLIEKIDNLLNSKKESGLSEEISLPNLYSIQLKNVSYSYETKENALRNLNLTLENKNKYAIVGTSGSGKSTILKLITGFIDSLYIGNIFLNNKNIREIKSEELLNYFSYIHQDTFIFNDTIENNITLFQNYSKEKLDKAIRDAQLYDLIEQLPEQMQYICSEDGSNLSGGEKQRIAIARALLRDSPVIVLDEGTRALDNGTASKIEEILLHLNDKLIIVVSHKLEENFLNKFDQIICLHKGEVTETGSFYELVKKKQFFFSLYNVYK
ncbi:ABC transporter ATP-binding protein [Lysinibacillus xylanilyticus]|uniref:ABC transporter ATP-binding protein n=1 Tax=Lysinibacillus xylanilyticus TaxID=582475 RepID=UPI00083CA573|nr:ABC transporter ATP-binding protein [Lysinibacillus xylanilyticus]